MTEPKISYYDFLRENDIISKVKIMLTQLGYYLRDVDGKIIAEKHLYWDTPWHHVRHHNDLDCATWHKVMFDIISRNLPEDERFVPSKCHDCYKVVIKPRTLVELFATLELQKKLNLPSKCGIETRETVSRLYGGYFYNTSLEEGLECYKMVRAEADRFKFLGKDVPVILKRACTEYEHECGDSTKWEVTDKQLHIERLVNRFVVREDANITQSEQALTYLHRKWIEWAFKNGDQTYKEFTNGEPLYPDYVTYHHLAEQ